MWQSATRAAALRMTQLLNIQGFFPPAVTHGRWATSDTAACIWRCCDARGGSTSLAASEVTPKGRNIGEPNSGRGDERLGFERR